MELRWATLDGESGNTLKQHCFKPCTRRRPYTLEPYEGNRSLCGHVSVSEDGHGDVPIEEIGNEPKAPDACKVCLKRLSKLTT